MWFSSHEEYDSFWSVCLVITDKYCTGATFITLFPTSWWMVCYEKLIDQSHHNFLERKTNLQSVPSGHANEIEVKTKNLLLSAEFLGNIKLEKVSYQDKPTCERNHSLKQNKGEVYWKIGNKKMISHIFYKIPGSGFIFYPRKEQGAQKLLLYFKLSPFFWAGGNFILFSRRDLLGVACQACGKVDYRDFSIYLLERGEIHQVSCTLHQETAPLRTDYWCGMK